MKKEKEVKEKTIRDDWIKDLEIVAQAPRKERVVMIEMEPKKEGFVLFKMIKMAHSRGCTIVIPRKKV